MKFTFNFKRVYVWELPVRIFHWLTVLSMIVLVITGFIIADPPTLSSSTEPTFLGRFAFVRNLHFTFAYILIANIIFRLYWSFVGNEFSNWRNFIPYTKKGIQNIFYVLKVDILLMKDKEHKLSNISIGHNYLASLSYSIMMIVFFFQAITGFALYSNTSTWWFPQMFGFANEAAGDIFIRYIHHILTWVFMAFVVVHVYLVLYHDYLEARGEASAMISGYKFVRTERMKHDEDQFVNTVKEQMWSGGEREIKIEDK